MPIHKCRPGVLEIHELYIFQKQPSRDPDGVEVENEFQTILRFQRLVVGIATLTIFTGFFVEPFSVVGTDPPVALRLWSHQVPQARKLAIPILNLDGSMNGVRRRELLLEGPLQRLGVVGHCDPVDVLAPIGLVLLRSVFVEGPVDGADEDAIVGPTELLFVRRINRS